MRIQLSKGERLDDLQNGYYLIQNTADFCFGLDAVLLAWFAGLRPGDRVLDMGCGNGVIPILLRAGESRVHITGLEIQAASAGLARRNVAYNHLEDSVTIVTGDIKEAVDRFGRASFSVVISNPPYMTGGHGMTGERESRSIAKHEILCTLEDVISQTSAVLKEHGRFYLVHRPFRLAEILTLMVKYRVEPKRMRLVQSYADSEPNLVLIEGLRGGRSRMKVEPSLVVFQEPGVYTEEVDRIYGRNRKENHYGG